MIEYNGIKFEKIEELIKYKEWEQGLKHSFKSEEKVIVSDDKVEFPSTTFRRWSKSELKNFKELLLEGKNFEEIAWVLGRTKKSVQEKYYQSFNKKLKKQVYPVGENGIYPFVKRNKWTAKEISFLKSNLKMNIHDLARQLGRTHNSVSFKIWELKLSKDRKKEKNSISTKEPNEEKSTKEPKKRNLASERMRWINKRTRELIPVVRDYNKAFLQASEEYRNRKPISFKAREEKLHEKIGLTEFGLESFKKLLETSPVSLKDVSIAIERADKKSWDVVNWRDFTIKIMNNEIYSLLRTYLGFNYIVKFDNNNNITLLKS